MKRNRRQRLATSTMVIGLAVCFLLNRPVWAQFTDSFQTNIIDGVVSNWAASYCVGNDYAFDQLQVMNGGVLAPDGGFYVGYNSGNGNSLVISNGGMIVSGNALIGYSRSLSANNNSALVTGSGSVWSNSDLHVGYHSSGNSLTISDGGFVSGARGRIGNFGDSNGVTVSGPGSVWNNSGNLYVGSGGGNNALLITSGGAVSSANAYIGWNNLSSNRGATNNTVLVSGSGSAWSYTAPLYVGYQCNGNSLTISDGGVVGTTIKGEAYVGSGGDNNSVQVNGPGSAWTNTYFLCVGSHGNTNSMVIKNGGTVLNDLGYIGDSGNNNSVLVSGTGSVWNTTGNLHVGYNGNANSLVISNGGRVATSAAYVGECGTNGSVLVTGSGSVWSNRGDLFIGNGPVSPTHSLVINNGGTAVNVNGYVGYGGNQNTVLVAGNGSVWTNQSNLYVGYQCNGNSLSVSNGGMVVAPNIVVYPNNSISLDGGTVIAANGLTISGNAVLKGSGMIYANLTLAGTLAPGNSPGVITNFGNLTLQTSAVLDMQLGGMMQGTEYDFILVTNGTVALDGLLRVSFINGFSSSVSSNDTFVLLQSNSPLGGSFTNAIGGFLITAGGEGTFYVDYSNNAVTLSGYQAIPEPSTWALGVVALVALLGMRSWSGTLGGRVSRRAVTKST